MGIKQVMYQDWMVGIEDDAGDSAGNKSAFPAERLFESVECLVEALIAEPSEPDEARKTRIIKAVNEAVEQLTETEQEFVVLYYVMGRTCRQIAEDSGRAMHKLEAMQGRIIRQLRNLLAGFVAEEFGLKVDRANSCPICNSQFRSEIDELLASKKETETWSRSIRALRDKYQIRIKTPQTLIGHIKFH